MTHDSRLVPHVYLEKNILAALRLTHVIFDSLIELIAVMYVYNLVPFG